MTPEEFDELPALLFISEAAEALGLSKTAVQALEARGELPTFGTGRRRVVKSRLLESVGLARPKWK